MAVSRNLPPIALGIAKARRLVGLAQRELGARVGVSGRSVSRWETGHWEPHRAQRLSLLKVFAELPPPMVRELTVLLSGVDPGPPAPAAAPAPEPVDVRALVDRLVLSAADQLDVGPRSLRAALATMLGSLDRAQIALPAVLAALAPAAPSAKK
jgi:transcriptional regulator with XRE-family HTH domain